MLLVNHDATSRDELTICEARAFGTGDSLYGWWDQRQLSVTKLQKQILSSERLGSSSVIILENSTTMGHGPSPSICNTTVRQTLISLLSIFAVRICQESTAISSFSLAGEDSASSRFLPCANTARQQRQRVCKILWGSSTTGSRRNPHLGHISEATVGSLQLARRMIRLLTEFVLRRNPNFRLYSKFHKHVGRFGPGRMET